MKSASSNKIRGVPRKKSIVLAFAFVSAYIIIRMYVVSERREENKKDTGGVAVCMSLSLYLDCCTSKYERHGELFNCSIASMTCEITF